MVVNEGLEPGVLIYRVQHIDDREDPLLGSESRDTGFDGVEGDVCWSWDCNGLIAPWKRRNRDRQVISSPSRADAPRAAPDGWWSVVVRPVTDRSQIRPESESEKRGRA